MDSATRRLVRSRAGDVCEYCLLHQRNSELTHHVEHIVAKQHGGSDGAHNLALACHRCNFNKGSNLAGIDPLSAEVVPLFHPRKAKWADNFAFDGVEIRGLTPSGRATIKVLALNDARRLELRRQLILLNG